MKEKVGPWLPAIFCASLALIVLFADLWALRNGGSSGAADQTFMMFMPMCFVLTGIYLSVLRKDISELRKRLDAAGNQTDS